MGALWVVTQAAAMQPTAPPSESSSPDSAKVSSSVSPKNASSIEIFTWGNVAAFLLLAGGGAYALYLRQEYGGATGSTTRFRPLGQMALGQSKQLRLVACGGDVLLLGVTDDDIALLKTYPRDTFDDLDTGDALEETVPSANGREDPPNTMPDGFSDVLDRFVQRGPQS